MSPRRWQSSMLFLPAKSRYRGSAADWQLQAETTRCLLGYRGASGPSWIPSRRPSHDLLRQQLLHSICTAGRATSENKGWSSDGLNLSLAECPPLAAPAVPTSPTTTPPQPQQLVGYPCASHNLPSCPRSPGGFHSASLGPHPRPLRHQAHPSAWCTVADQQHH